MFIAATAPKRRVKLRRSGMLWVSLVVIASPIRAAPTELDAPYGARGYKHGAPNGAFRGPPGTPQIGKRSVQDAESPAAFISLSAASTTVNGARELSFPSAAFCPNADYTIKPLAITVAVQGDIQGDDPSSWSGPRRNRDADRERLA